ncbi:MAG: hypothetical protein KR126chlam1_00448 [Chlamydiae bacterium]|nr:hypothetical protein [Chlamydiota bacterium]
MLSKRRLFLFTLLTLAILVVVHTAIPRKKAGFSLTKIRSPFVPSSKWKTPPPSPSEELIIREIFSQEFNYLGSGAQCYAFLSADGKYVLKFFRMKHLIPKTWLNYLPIPGLSDYRFRKIDKRVLRQEALFSSYKMAYEELKEETGLIFVHLNKSKDLDLEVNLNDRMRKRYTVNLDEFEFILQKKAQLVRDRIALLLQKGDPAGAIQAINALLQQVVEQSKKGFVDRDTGVSHNYGFVGDQVIHFDVGRIMRDEQAKDPSVYQRELLRVGKKLESWLEVLYPYLLPSLEEEINRMIDLPSS